MILNNIHYQCFCQEIYAKEIQQKKILMKSKLIFKIDLKYRKS